MYASSLGQGLPAFKDPETFAKTGDPSSMLPGESTTYRIGSRMSPQGYGAGAERQANRYEGTSSCPPGQVVVSHGSTPIRAAYIGAPTTSPFVYCKPQPVYRPAPAPAPVAGPTYTTTISPVLQTEVSPMISPVFQQVQDSPGATQAGAPTMVAPGGMEAEGGSAGNGSAAMLEFMRLQSEQDAARRADEAAAREVERRDAVAREDAYRKQQLDFQREQAALQADRQAAIDAGAADEAARLTAQYEAAQAEWETTRATPGGFVSTAVMPGREMIGPEVPAPMPLEKPGLPMPLIVGLGAAVLVGGYFLATQKKGQRT